MLALIAGLGQSPVRAEEKADEWKGLVGTWGVEKVVRRGEDITELLSSAVLTLETGKYTTVFAGEEDRGTITVDGAKKPKVMKIESTEGTNKGKTFLAIYELSDDTLRVCYDLDGKAYPKSLESKPDTNTLFMVYKRAKK